MLLLRANRLLLIATLLPAMAGATRTVSVHASGEVRTFPDQADLVLEMEATREKVKASMDQVQVAMRGAYAVFAGFASDSGDLTAGQISVDKEYRWVNNTQVFKGYHCVQTLTLRLKDLRRIGELLEAVSAVRITRISGVYYSHSAQDSLERIADAKAMVNARLAADGLAKGCGAALGDALRIANGTPSDFDLGGAEPGMEYLTGAMGRVSPSKAKAGYLVKPDQIVVTAQVFATYELRNPKSGEAAKRTEP